MGVPCPSDFFCRRIRGLLLLLLEHEGLVGESGKVVVSEVLVAFQLIIHVSAGIFKSETSYGTPICNLIHATGVVRHIAHAFGAVRVSLPIAGGEIRTRSIISRDAADIRIAWNIAAL